MNRSLKTGIRVLGPYLPPGVTFHLTIKNDGLPLCGIAKPKRYRFSTLAVGTTCKRCMRTMEYKRRLKLWKDAFASLRNSD